jgi:hypothetical protein
MVVPRICLANSGTGRGVFAQQIAMTTKILVFLMANHIL